MEEDSWVCVDESFSNDENSSDSDKIDSETEAELYSLIHFEGNLSSVSCESSTTKNDKPDAAVLLSDKMKYILSTEKSECNRETEFIGNLSNVLQNGMNKPIGIKNYDKTVSDNSLVKVFHEDEKILHIDHEVLTDFANNSNSNQLAKTQFSYNSNKRKFDPSLPNYSSPPKKAATNSGSETNLFDVDSLENKDIQTNICEDEDNDIIFISSDSETDNSAPFNIRISPRQNMSMPNIKIGESSKDLWFVNQEDISRARNIKSRRYHDKVDATCSNCNGKGHYSRTCHLSKTMKCFTCGGEHTSSACINRICGKCYRTGHDRKSCLISHVGFCELCHMQGHIKKDCPDLWRRYHLTTQPGKIVPDKKVNWNSSVFCCKCGHEGHFGAVCNFAHGGYKNCFSTWPNVLSYKEPYSLPVQTANTSGNKQNIEKKNLVIRRKKKNPNEAQRLAKNARLLKKKELKRQNLQNLKISKVLKEKDFPRTPKNNCAINLTSPRTEKNNSAINPFSAKTSESDDVVILPTPKTKKIVSIIDLASPKTPKKNFFIGLNTTKAPKKNNAFNESNDLPESVQQMMLVRAKRRERNRKRRLKRRQNRLKEREKYIIKDKST